MKGMLGATALLEGEGFHERLLGTTTLPEGDDEGVVRGNHPS